jgi:hypothetical protein
MTLLAAAEIQRFGLQPKVALPSHLHMGLINMSALTSVRVQRAREAQPEALQKTGSDRRIRNLIRRSTGGGHWPPLIGIS